MCRTDTHIDIINHTINYNININIKFNNYNIINTIININKIK